MTETAHTPTPWNVKYNNKTSIGVSPGNISIANCKMQGLFQETQEANAAFIVKACNAHDELVEVLKSYRDEVLDGVCGQASHDRVMQINETIRAILAKVQS